MKSEAQIQTEAYLKWLNEEISRIENLFVQSSFICSNKHMKDLMENKLSSYKIYQNNFKSAFEENKSLI